MAGMRVRVDNKMNKLAAKVGTSVETVLAAGAAMMQREIMMAAMAMSIWDTGNLINSHTRRKVSASSWEILSPAEYSIYVHGGAEYKGGADGITGARSLIARPWFHVGMDAAEPKVMAMVKRAVLGA